jgi:hypothetical protein
VNDSELMLRPASGPSAVVPIDYAEKAMGSLMQLHGELMEEKERRVDLYRRLMEKEQTLAELRMYVKLLEDKVEKDKVAAPEREAPTPPAAPARSPPRPPPPPRPLTLVRSAPIPVPRERLVRHHPAPPPPPPARPPARGFMAADGWKAW